jgi:heme exporter protein C
LDSVHALAASKLRLLSENVIEAQFAVPKAFPYKKESYLATLIVDGPKNGVSIMPAAVAIRPDSMQHDADATAANAWVSNPVVSLNSTPFVTFPYRGNLYETIRNTYFHVPLWFAMFLLFFISVIYAFRSLATGKSNFDHGAHAFALVGTVFGVLGLITGAVWAKNTWGAYWSFDIKQNMSLVAVLIYCAYFVLRSSFDDDARKARISAVYNIFAFTSLVPLLFVIPRMYDSLHPGNGGNPAMGGEDLDNTMRMVFYPAIIAFMLIGVWISQLWYRYLCLTDLSRRISRKRPQKTRKDA